MSTVTSSDGSTIAYSKTGSGPALILVDGALCYRDFGPAKKFTEALSDTFTVYTYDRRGRGESGTTEPFDMQREVEDLAAMVKEASGGPPANGGVAGGGGSPYVFGQSSGAALALEAANAGEPISKLAVYEAPFIVDPSGPVGKDEQYWPEINRAIADGRNGDAVKHFMRLVGVPGLMVTLFPLMPAWKKLKAVAPTLPHDEAVLASNRTGRPLPEDRYEGVRQPVLSMAGGKSEEWFRNGMRNVAERVADGRYRTIDGQNHMLKAAAVAPVLKEFFGS